MATPTAELYKVYRPLMTRSHTRLTIVRLIAHSHRFTTDVTIPNAALTIDRLVAALSISALAHGRLESRRPCLALHPTPARAS